MPDEPQNTPTNDPKPEPRPADDFKPITSQDELNRLVGERVARERAKYADYDDVKAKAEAHDAALEAAKSDADKAIDAARKEGESAAEQRANARVVRAEAKAAAGGRFHDPEVAVRLLDLSDVAVKDDGSVPADSLKAKLDELAEKHPYLLATNGEKPRPAPDRHQGGGGSTAKGGLIGLSGDELYERMHKKPA